MIPDSLVLIAAISAFILAMVILLWTARIFLQLQDERTRGLATFRWAEIRAKVQNRSEHLTEEEIVRLLRNAPDVKVADVPQKWIGEIAGLRRTWLHHGSDTE
jgi:hypothetical protein